MLKDEVMLTIFCRKILWRICIYRLYIDLNICIFIVLSPFCSNGVFVYSAATQECHAAGMYDFHPIIVCRHRVHTPSVVLSMDVEHHT